MVNKLPDSIDREFTFKHITINEGRTDFGVSDVDVSTHLTRNIRIKGGPLIPAPMDTVMSAESAIAVADLGFLPTAHYNYEDSPNNRWFERQADVVRRVKRARSGFITKPITLKPSDPIEEADKLLREYPINSIAVTEDGTPHGRFAGIVTKYDYSLHQLPGEGDPIDAGSTIGEKMIPLSRLHNEKCIIHENELGNDGDDRLWKAYRVLLQSHRGIMPIVDGDGNLYSLVSRTDVDHRLKYPDATRDEKGRLMVFAAIGTREEDREAAEALVKAGVDGFIVETSHAYTRFVFDMLEYLKLKFPDKDVIVGNSTNPGIIEELLKREADAIKVGIGPGSICTTTTDGGVGRPPLSATYRMKEEAERLAGRYYIVPIIGDGGGKTVGDIMKYIACGADVVMSGRLFAGSKEAPGEYKHGPNGRWGKEYRGMGSEEAMKVRGGNRYFLEDQKRKFPQGFVDFVEDRGSLYDWTPLLMSGLKTSMQVAGCRNIRELQERAEILHTYQ